MNENEFCNVYIQNRFNLILVLPIIYSYYNIFFLVLFIEYITTILYTFYIVKVQFSFTAASFLLQ